MQRRRHPLRRLHLLHLLSPVPGRRAPPRLLATQGRGQGRPNPVGGHARTGRRWRIWCPNTAQAPPRPDGGAMDFRRAAPHPCLSSAAAGRRRHGLRSRAPSLNSLELHSSPVGFELRWPSPHSGPHVEVGVAVGAAFSRRLRRGRRQVPRQPAVAAAWCWWRRRSRGGGWGLVAGGGGGAEGAAGLEAGGSAPGIRGLACPCFFILLKKTLPSVRFNTR